MGGNSLFQLRNELSAMHVRIEKSTPADIASIFELYNAAANFQRSKKTVVVWPEFEVVLVKHEIAEGRQFKLCIGGELACVWAVAFSDPQIWEERDKDPSIYIHRIATAPRFRGLRLVKQIVDWAKEYAKANTKKFVRLDTLGENTRLINYYQEMGFTFLGIHVLKNTKGLPSHYHQAPACLFEIKL